MVYQKQGDEEVWLEYCASALWVIVSAEGKGGKSAGRYAFSMTANPILNENTSWGVWTGSTFLSEGEFEGQSLIVRHKEKPSKATEPLHNNFERCVKETQIRLWCYRKVVHKAFADTMAKFVRYQFPRRLKDHVETAIHKSLQVGMDAFQGSSSPLLLALMAETEELGRQRKTLQMSVRRHEEALAVMAELKKTLLALHEHNKT